MTTPRDDQACEIAKGFAGTMAFLWEEEFKQISDDESRKEYALLKWRRMLAINEVSQEYPIHYSRYFPQMIALSWFFGLPAFDRAQDMDRLRRAWGETAAFAQGDLFKEIARKAVLKIGKEDSDFHRMVAEMKEIVIKTFKREKSRGKSKAAR